MLVANRPERWACGLLLLALGACNGESPQLDLAGEALGTTWSVKLGQPTPGLDDIAVLQAMSLALDGVDRKMSTYRKDSELSRFNAYAGADWFPVSADTVTVVAEAQRWADLSNGAFDITVGPLVNLWGFGPGQRISKVPQPSDLEAVRAKVGFHMLEYRQDPPALRKAHPELYVDLSSIAKGYAVDQMASALEALGTNDYLVEVGGELRVRGLSGRNQPWRVAIERPIAGQRTVERVMEPGSTGLATSGDYRNYFDENGQRYSHTIDPSTAAPIEHNLASVTALHPSAMVADAMATTLLVLGPEQGMDLCESERLAALMIVRSSDGFEVYECTAFLAVSSNAIQ